MDPSGNSPQDWALLWGSHSPDWRTDSYISDEILIFGESRPPRSEIDVLLDDIMSGLMASMHPVFGPAVVESKRRLPKVGELLAMKPRQQRRAVRRAPYRDLVLANCLLDECNKFAALRPEEAEQCARLAEGIADQPWPDEPEKAAEIRIVSLLSQAEVFRLQRDWKKAELRFAAAYALLRGRIAHHTHSTFCLYLYRLRADQGRYQEAELLLMWSIRIHGLLWDSHQVFPDDLCRLAVLALKQNDPGRAMTIVTGLFLDQESDPIFETVRDQIDVIRAICMAAIGDAEAVRTLMADAQPRWRCGSDRDASLPFEWIECQIAAHLGDLDQAIPRLEAIRRWLSGKMKLDEICLVSIDLAVAYARKGQAAQRLPDLLADLAERREAAENPWVLGSLWRFREELDRTKDPIAAAREAVEIVHRREMSLQGLSARRYPIRKKSPSGKKKL
jgi:hypothetical protein